MSETERQPADEESSTKNPLRRRIVQVFGGLGVASFAGAMLAPLKNLGIAAGGSGGELSGQELVLASSYTPNGGGETFEVGATITEDMLSVPDSALVYPANHVDQNDFLIRLHRLEPDEIGPPTVEDMTANGYVAYSAICTHLGCTVDWAEDQEADTGNPTNYCNCHGSQFDPYRGAEVVNPPADKPLPQIGVALEEGQITLNSDFEAKVGP